MKESVDLETWLRNKHMSTIEFTKKIGCSRPIIWKVKNRMPICKFYANKIIEATNGEVAPVIRVTKVMNEST